MKQPPADDCVVERLFGVRTYAADVSVSNFRTSGLLVAWTVVLAAGAVVWVIAPDIPVTETNGSGCGQWNRTELEQHREQLGLRMLPFLSMAEGIGAAWVIMRRARLAEFAASAAGGLSLAFLLLWQPSNVAFVWSQLLSIVVVPALALAILIWLVVAVPKARSGSQPAPGAALLLALVPPFVFIALVLWTRTPWIWTC